MSELESMSSISDNDDSPICPLCYNELDATDQSLLPCPCNFQVCLWCLKQLMDSSKPCPNCRRPYNENNFRRIEVHERRRKSVHSKVQDDNKKEDSRHSSQSEDAQDLQTVRVIQRNLVYVIGLPNESASESILRRRDMFGQYGKLNKIVFNNRNPIGDRSNTCGVYLTYETNEQALSCINAVDGYMYLHRMLKASYGTTKYCYTFIRGQKCSNPDCLYLHRLAPPEDCFTKEEMSKRQEEFHMQTHPGRGSYWDVHLQRCIYRKPSDEYNTSLPPPSPKLGLQPRGKQEKSKEKEKEEISPEEPFVIRASLQPVILSIHSQDLNYPVESNDGMQATMPFTFEALGKGLHGCVFGLPCEDTREKENVNIERLIRSGNILQESPTAVRISQQEMGYNRTN